MSGSEHNREDPPRRGVAYDKLQQDMSLKCAAEKNCRLDQKRIIPWAAPDSWCANRFGECSFPPDRRYWVQPCLPIFAALRDVLSMSAVFQLFSKASALLTAFCVPLAVPPHFRRPWGRNTFLTKRTKRKTIEICVTWQSNGIHRHHILSAQV